MGNISHIIIRNISTATSLKQFFRGCTVPILIMKVHTNTGERLKEESIQSVQVSERETIVCPTFGENLRYFFRYQIGFMYLRYFMWNFAGRQNDIQGNGNPLHGNWISGIKFIDEARLGNLDNVSGGPENKSRAQ